MSTGVYRWFCRVSTKSYVGGAYVSLHRREYEHRLALNSNTHFNKHLQHAWNRYGELAFEFQVLVECQPAEVLGLEQYWIDGLQAYLPDCGYNKSPTAESTLGFKWSEESRKRMSEVARNRPPELIAQQVERCRNLGKLKLGIPRCPEATAKTAESLRGRKRSPETIAKIVASRLASGGFNHSEEVKDKIREVMNRPEVKERCRHAALNRRKKC